MKVKSFCTAKEMVCKLKRLLTELEKIFVSYTSEKGLITRIYRELKKLNSPKFNGLMKKRAKELNRAFSKEEIQMANNIHIYEEMLTIPSHKENSNQIHVKFPPHSC
jgi:poly-D-alanine transfer protein DltD